MIQWIEVLKLGSLEIGSPVWSGPTALLHSLGMAWVELVSLFTSERDAGGVQVTVTLDHAHMDVLVANLLMVSEGKGGANLQR